MLLKDIEVLKEEEPKVDMKRLTYFFKKMPLQFPTILDAYLDAMVLDYLGHSGNSFPESTFQLSEHSLGNLI